MKELIISIQDERPLSCIDSKACGNTIPLKTHSTAKYAFTEDGCKCPFTSTTAESSVVTPTLSRVNSHAFTIKALLHCATLVQSTKYGRVDGFDKLVWDTSWCQAHRAPDPVTVANMYVRWPKQVRSHNASRHGLQCRCQHQSLLNLDGHYNTRLFKLSRPKGREISTNFPLTPRRAQDSPVNNYCCGCWVSVSR